MDLEAIKQIIELMESSELAEFEIEEEGFKLRIRRSAGEPPAAVAAGTVPQFPSAFAEPVAVPEATPASHPTGDQYDIAKDEHTDYIKSPMVGTFYRASSPDGPPFVESGAEVQEDTAVCIIEAMKVMNEIQAETTGRVVEILAENGQSVEFGQPLFKVTHA